MPPRRQPFSPRATGRLDSKLRFSNGRWLVHEAAGSFPGEEFVTIRRESLARSAYARFVTIADTPLFWEPICP